MLESILAISIQWEVLQHLGVAGVVGLLVWAANRSPPNYRHLTYVGYHRVVVALALALPLEMVVFSGVFAYRDDFGSALGFGGLGLVFGLLVGWVVCQAFVFREDGFLARTWRGWSRHAWEEIQRVECPRSSTVFRLILQRGGTLRVSVLMTGWQLFIRELALRSGLSLPAVKMIDGETFHLVPRRNPESQDLPEVVEDVVRHHSIRSTAIPPSSSSAGTFSRVTPSGTRWSTWRPCIWRAATSTGFVTKWATRGWIGRRPCARPVWMCQSQRRCCGIGGQCRNRRFRP